MVNFTQTALAVLMAASAVQGSYDFLGYPDVVYEPNSQVTDHAAIDLDQKSIGAQLGKSVPDFVTAKKIYTDGGNSKSYAVIELGSALTTDYKKGTAISGPALDGSTVSAMLYKDANQGDIIINVQYDTGDDQENYSSCRVGALPSDEQVTSGCFDGSGTITISNNEEISYTYDVAVDNKNGRTIQGFSTSARDKMFACTNCPYTEYEKYFDYYGAHDYADKWIMAAFDGTSTNFDNGNADFSKYVSIGKIEAAKKGTAYMAVYMYVLREFEDALDDCKKGCINCNDDPVHAWDEGVAFYTGSQQATGSGELLFALADKRCANFKTCGADGTLASGISHVNHKVFSMFAKGRDALLGGNCDSVRPIISDITDMMAVPLIQGTMRYAYKIDKLNEGEKGKGEGAIFAAAILPRLHDCSNDDAKIVYDNMGVSASSTDHTAVKNAFERNYECMGIGCNMVGGLLSGVVGGGYYVGAEPCNIISGESPAPSVGAGLPMFMMCLIFAAHALV